MKKSLSNRFSKLFIDKRDWKKKARCKGILFKELVDIKVDEGNGEKHPFIESDVVEKFTFFDRDKAHINIFPDMSKDKKADEKKEKQPTRCWKGTRTFFYSIKK